MWPRLSAPPQAFKKSGNADTKTNVNTDNIFKGKPENNMDKSKENITNAVSSFVISVESEVVPSLTLWELP